jgi:cystathionine beta-lyase
VSFETNRSHQEKKWTGNDSFRLGFEKPSRFNGLGVRPGDVGDEACVAMEKALSRLERGARTVSFASPWAAMCTVFLQFSRGDHVIVDKDVSGETRRLILHLAPRMGLAVSWVDASDPDDLAEQIQPHTKAVYVENLSGPGLKVTDLKAVCRIAKAYRLCVIVDNTLLTPCFQRPLELGADLVVHRGAHWLSGRCDVRTGFVVAGNEEAAGPLLAMRNLFGVFPDPVESHRIREGFRTLQVRMETAAMSAEKVALWLERHPLVKRVAYPGLPTHPGNEAQHAQSDGHGGVLVFDTGSPQLAHRIMKRVRLPLTPLRPADRERLEAVTAVLSRISSDDMPGEAGGEGLLRLSVGLISADDLIGDLARALK